MILSIILYPVLSGLKILVSNYYYFNYSFLHYFVVSELHYVRNEADQQQCFIREYLERFNGSLYLSGWCI